MICSLLKPLIIFKAFPVTEVSLLWFSFTEISLMKRQARQEIQANSEVQPRIVTIYWHCNFEKKKYTCWNIFLSRLANNTTGTLTKTTMK